MIDEKQLNTHVILVAWLNILSNAFVILMACLAFFFFTGIGIAIEDARVLPILSIVGVVAGLFMVVLAVPGIIAGIGLLMRKSWGRILALVVGVFSLLSIPLGTLIGGYTLFVLLQDSATAYFTATSEESGSIVPDAG